jgi:hypothetical protein
MTPSENYLDRAAGNWPHDGVLVKPRTTSLEHGNLAHRKQLIMSRGVPEIEMIESRLTFLAEILDPSHQRGSVTLLPKSYVEDRCFATSIARLFVGATLHNSVSVIVDHRFFHTSTTPPIPLTLTRHSIGL